MSFPHAAQQVAASFAAGLGLPARPAQDGSFSFVFAQTGTLSLTASKDGRQIFVSLARKPQRVDGALLQNALERSGFDPSTNRIVRVGLASDGSLHLAVGLPEADFDLTTLTEAFRQLNERFDGLA